MKNRAYDEFYLNLSKFGRIIQNLIVFIYDMLRLKFIYNFVKTIILNLLIILPRLKYNLFRLKIQPVGKTVLALEAKLLFTTKVRFGEM